jgi:hypothetical protein
MPLYKVLIASYINDRLYPASAPGAGVFVDYGGQPGTNLEPTDDEGRTRQAAYFAARGQTVASATDRRRMLLEGADDRQRLGAEVLAPPPPASVVVHHVPIPPRWITFDTARLVGLAAKLGAPPETARRSEAIAFIQAEAARRAVN